MPGDDPTLGDLRAASASLERMVTIARDASAGPHISFDLPHKFEKYLASLDSRQRQNFQRRLKLLKKNFNVEVEVIQSSSVAQQEFARFKDLHDQQWHAAKKFGHFGDWPGAEQFNIDLVRKLSALGRFRLLRVVADNRILTCEYYFVFGGCCYWRLTARATEQDLSRFGLGIIGLVLKIQTVINEGVRKVEAGVGHYDYKLQFGGKEFETRSLVVSTRRAAFRTFVFLKLSNLLHLLYYRIWFLRIAPRCLKRPLWRTWIRCRL